MGEYARSLAIAQGAREKWPGVQIQFILSRDARYTEATPFPTTLLASSPTFHSDAVIGVMQNWRPDMVIFDNAGRTAQLRAARRLGSRIVFISARRRQRRKAFRLRWMRLIDEHWIAYPKFVAGELGFLERLKLKFLHRPVVRYLDVILSPASAATRNSFAPRIGCSLDNYVLIVPGGGTGHPGARDAVEQFLQAARALADAGINTVFVGTVGSARAGGGGLSPASRLRMLGSLPQPELAALMRGARLIVANGGSTLLQSIACGKPCVAVPIAGDQPERIRRCVTAGVAVAAPLESARIGKAATDLMQDRPQLDALAGRALALGLANGVDVALHAIATMMDW